MFLVCGLAVYLVVDLYGLSCLYIGVKAMIQRRAEVRYYVPRWSWKLELLEGRTTFIEGQAASRWGMGQVFSGILAAMPWLLLLVVPPTPITWWFVMGPFLAIGLHFVLSQVYGGRTNRYPAPEIHANRGR